MFEALPTGVVQRMISVLQEYKESKSLAFDDEVR